MMKNLAKPAFALMLGLSLAACGAASPATPSSAGETASALQPTVAAAATSIQPTVAAAATAIQPTVAALEPTVAAAATAVSDSVEATINQIATAADEWFGKPVTISGDVAQVYNDRAFAVNDTSGGPLLVIIPSGAALSQGQSVEVSGTVQQLDVAQIEQQLGITLDPSLSGMAGQPVIIADQVNG
jgi:hypothetical protein